MAEEHYDLVFRGELVPGADLAQVKQNLARLFKMDPARIEKLFGGQAIVLRRGLSMDAAAKYRIAIKKAGARVDTLPSKAPPKPAAPAPRAPERPEPAAAAATAEPDSSAASSPTAATLDKGGLTLAPPGAAVLEPASVPVAEAQIETGHLNLRPEGGTLVDEDEIAKAEPVAVKGEDFGLAPAGADVLQPEERLPLVEVDMDLSHLKAEAPGDRLEAPKPPAPPAPDVSGLSLVDE